MKKIANIIRNNYLVIFCIYYITVFLNITVLKIDYPIFDRILKIIRYFTYGLFFIRFTLILPDITKKMFNCKNGKQKLLILISFIFIITVLINFIMTKQKRLILLLLILVSSYDIDDEKIINNLWIMQIVMTMFIITLSVFGFLQNYYIMRENAHRYSLGFAYTTNLSQLILFAMLLNLYVKKFKISINEFIYIQLVNILLFFITQSRSEFIFVELIIIVSLIYNTIGLNNEKINKISKFFAYSFWIYPILSIVFVIMYPYGGIFVKINSLLSNRLCQTYEIIQLHGVKLFGEAIEFLGYGINDKLKYGANIVSNYVDNEYMQLLFIHGIVFEILFIILLNFMLVQIYKRKEHKKMFVCYIYLMFGLLNPRVINLVYSPIPFILFNEIIYYLNNNEKKDVVKEK